MPATFASRGDAGLTQRVSIADGGSGQWVPGNVKDIGRENFAAFLMSIQVFKNVGPSFQWVG